MSILEKSAPWWKKFLHGDGGYAHAAQELGIFAIGWVAMYFITPVLALPLIIGAIKNSHDYWYDREVKQYKKYHDGKHPGAIISSWKDKDAIADVLVPDRARPIWIVLTLLVALWILKGVGITGYIYYSTL